METIIIKKQKSLAASVPDTPAAPSPAEPVLTLSQLRSVFEAAQSPEACGVQLSIADDVRADLQRGAALVQSIVQRGEVVYGINTGFGNLANKKIDEADTRLLQSSLVRSHAAVVGEPLEPALVRLIMLLKIQSLCRGYSGVRPALVAALTALFNSGLVPVIPAKGSVGASGDLAPLAHLSLVLMCEGELLEDGKRGIIDDDALCKLVAAMQHTMTHSAYHAHIADDAVLFVRNSFNDKLNRVRVRGAIMIDCQLGFPLRLVPDERAGKRNLLHHPDSQNILRIPIV